MMEQTDDHGKVTIISHICLLDPDTGEIILNQRDVKLEKVMENDDR